MFAIYILMFITLCMVLIWEQACERNLLANCKLFAMKQQAARGAKKEQQKLAAMAQEAAFRVERAEIEICLTLHAARTLNSLMAR